eukprot:294989-Hanusia_phi.AAC.1
MMRTWGTATPTRLRETRLNRVTGGRSPGPGNANAADSEPDSARPQYRTGSRAKQSPFTLEKKNLVMAGNYRRTDSEPIVGCHSVVAGPGDESLFKSEQT